MSDIPERRPLEDGVVDERLVPDRDAPGAELAPAPGELLTREAVMILSAFRRFSPAQIAATLRIGVEEVQAIRDDAECRDIIETLSGTLPRPGDLHDLLMSDAERNVLWLRKLREGRVDGDVLGTDAKTLAVRAGAARSLLERQIPKKVEVHAIPAREVTYTDEAYGRMSRLLQGDYHMPTPALPAPAPVPQTPAAGRLVSDDEL